MANLLSIAEQTWSQLFPGEDAPVDREDFVATAKTEYAYQMWLKSKADKREEGEFLVPSYLLSEIEADVKNNEIDLSSLKIMRGLDHDQWLLNVGGIMCECKYVKTTFNHAQLLCDDDDDGLPTGTKLYYVVGKKIKFPRGTHKSKLPVTYANYGENVEGEIEVDDVIGGLVRRALVEIYGGKTGKKDDTNDSSSNEP